MTIKTAGDLRSFLAGIMVDIKNGNIDAEQAGAISKVSAQINQSLAVEVKAAIEMHKLGKGGHSAGSMLIGTEKPLELDTELWCEQCDAMVDRSDVPNCKSKFCSVKDKL